jgi:tetratricopeptide (TPR) repeat protein
MSKQLLALAICFLTFMATEAQQIKTPQPSPTQTIKQDFGIGTIEVSYSRPGVKGRKIFGELVPFNKVWRTGANQATILNFSDSVKIGNTKLAPGKYGLLSIPDKDQWVLIITKQLDVTNPTAYRQDMDLVRINVKATQLKDPVETFTMQFANIKPTTAELQIMWEMTEVSLPISTEYDRKVLADIDRSLQDSRPYYQAALYYMESGHDLNQALVWFDRAIEQNPSAYWVYHQKANAQAMLGRKDAARATAQKSMDLAREQKNDDYVKLNEKLLEKLK